MDLTSGRNLIHGNKKLRQFNTELERYAEHLKTNKFSNSELWMMKYGEVFYLKLKLTLSSGYEQFAP